MYSEPTIIEVDPYADKDDDYACTLYDRHLGTCSHPDGEWDCHPHTCPLRKQPLSLLIKIREIAT